MFSTKNATIGGIVGTITQQSSVNYCNTNAVITCSVRDNPNQSYSQNASLGGIVGSCGRSQISCCYSEGSVTGNKFCKAGGIAGGIISTASIVNCYSNISVLSRISGGIVGSSQYSNVSYYYSLGDVTSIDKGSAGGIVGSHIYTNVNYCFSLGNILGQDHAGNITGSYADDVENCYYCKGQSITITNIS